MDTMTRNHIFMENIDLINRTLRRHRLLLYALHLELDDVYQELAIAALQAIDTYDTAMRYQDQVIAQTLDLAEAAARSEKPVIWSYISDHGQELGEAENRTGHSQTTPDGYRVPFVVWSSDGRFKKPIEDKPFRADLLDSWMLSAAGIECKDEMPKEDIASQQYDFDAPKLPMRDPELEAYREN